MHITQIREALHPVVESLLDRHLSNADEWFPHQYVPWERGVAIDDTRSWDDDPSLDPAERQPRRHFRAVTLTADERLGCGFVDDGCAAEARILCAGRAGGEDYCTGGGECAGSDVQHRQLMTDPIAAA